MDTQTPKPDMLAASPRAGGGKRILAALEHGARPAPKPPRAGGWTIDSWTVGLGLLLLLMVSVAWMMHEQTITPATFKYHARDSRTAAVPRLELPAAPESAQAAAIVNTAASSADAGPAGATTPDRPDRPALAGTQRASATDGPAHAASPSHKPALAGVGGGAGPGGGSGGTGAGARPGVGAGLGPGPAVRAPQPATQTAAATARNASGSGTSAAKAAVRDTDVTLLAALVAHANKPTVTVAERSRDVVERKEGDTTAQLLARCQQLGLIEGMLCRSRICADRWDADPACRAPAH